MRSSAQEERRKDMARVWHKVGGGTFFKFDTPGKSLEGIWRGTEPSAMYEHDNGVIQVEGGERKIFTVNTALIKTLARIRRGAEIRIEYIGKRKAKTGTTEYKDFEVFVGDPDNDYIDAAEPTPVVVVEKPASDRQAPEDDEEVPF
jgi:hypothetical protein